MKPFGSPMVLEQRRLQAISLLDKGFAPVEVSRKIGVDRSSVRRWKAAYRRKGSQALKAKPISGRPLKLAPNQRKRLERYLLRGPRASGFSTDLWTCPRIAALIQNEFKVRYHVDHVGRLLHSLGWSPQKPERCAIERNEQAIKNWVRYKWPRIKKAQQPKATIVSIDESGILMSPIVRRTWSPRGCTPVFLQRGRTYQKISMIAAVTTASQALANRIVF